MIRVSGLYGHGVEDYEHKQVIQMLRALGFSPSYDKAADIAKLRAAKTEIAQKVINKKENDNTQQMSFKDTLAQSEEMTSRQKLEEERVGAMALADLKKILLGL